MIKNIILDWTGVISDSCPTSYEVAMKIFKKFGAAEISLEEYRREWEQPYMRFYNKYMPDLSLEDENAAYKEFILDCKKPNIIEGMRDFLFDLKKAGKKLIIISGDMNLYINREIERFGLEGIFDEINSNVHDKEEIIEEIMERNGFKPEETIFVGDTTHEIEAGKRAGLSTLAVTWGVHDEVRLKSAKPDFIVHNLSEFRKIIFG